MGTTTSSRAIYANPAWKIVRLHVLNRDQWRCQIGSNVCTKVATEADHIVSLIDGGHPFDPNNLRAACKACNAGRRQRERRRHTSTAPPPSRQW